jgi:hypothetical protein
LLLEESRAEVRISDRPAAEVAMSLAEDVDAIHEFEEVFERHEQAMREHDAMHAFVAHFQGFGGVARGRGDKVARGGQP